MAMKFVPAKKKKLIGKSGGPPPWIRNFTIGVIVFAVVLSEFGFYAPGSFLRSHLPLGNTWWFWVYLVGLVTTIIVAVAVGSHYWEVSRASHWVMAPGKILRSEMTSERRRLGNDEEKIENAPAIEYEFETPGGTVRGSRIDLSGDSGGDNSLATLERYPKGATVTVFYDPDDPANCTLERGGTKDLTFTGCFTALAALAAFLGAGYWLIVHGPAFVRAHFPKADNAEFAVAAFGFGAFALYFYFAFRRYTQQAANWPTVPGKIVASSVESFRERKENSSLMTTHYRPLVEYTYDVRGRSYRGNQVTLGVKMTGMQGFAERLAAKYPEGKAVTVYYNPANPGTATLEIPRGATWLPLIIVAVCVALVVWQLGLFK